MPGFTIEKYRDLLSRKLSDLAGEEQTQVYVKMRILLLPSAARQGSDGEQDWLGADLPAHDPEQFRAILAVLLGREDMGLRDAHLGFLDLANQFALKPGVTAVKVLERALARAVWGTTPEWRLQKTLKQPQLYDWLRSLLKSKASPENIGAEPFCDVVSRASSSWRYDLVVRFRWAVWAEAWPDLLHPTLTGHELLERTTVVWDSLVQQYSDDYWGLAVHPPFTAVDYRTLSTAIEQLDLKPGSPDHGSFDNREMLNWLLYGRRGGLAAGLGYFDRFLRRHIDAIARGLLRPVALRFFPTRTRGDETVAMVERQIDEAIFGFGDQYNHNWMNSDTVSPLETKRNLRQTREKSRARKEGAGPADEFEVLPFNFIHSTLLKTLQPKPSRKWASPPSPVIVQNGVEFLPKAEFAYRVDCPPRRLSDGKVSIGYAEVGTGKGRAQRYYPNDPLFIVLVWLLLHKGKAASALDISSGHVRKVRPKAKLDEARTSQKVLKWKPVLDRLAEYEQRGVSLQHWQEGGLKWLEPYLEELGEMVRDQRKLQLERDASGAVQREDDGALGGQDQKRSAPPPQGGHVEGSVKLVLDLHAAWLHEAKLHEREILFAKQPSQKRLDELRERLQRSAEDDLEADNLSVSARMNALLRTKGMFFGSVAQVALDVAPKPAYAALMVQLKSLEVGTLRKIVAMAQVWKAATIERHRLPRSKWPTAPVREFYRGLRVRPKPPDMQHLTEQAILAEELIDNIRFLRDGLALAKREGLDLDGSWEQDAGE